KKRAPGLKPGALAQTAGFSLAADLDGGSTTKAEGAAVRRDHLDPQCILVLEVRGVAGLAQRIQAGLLRTRGCGVEARQLEDYPRAFVHLGQPEGNGRGLGAHLDLGTGTYVGAGAGQGVGLAVAAESEGLLSSSTRSATSSSTRRTTAAGSTTRSAA